MIRNTLKKSLLVLLALTFCVCLLPSCTKKTDPLAKSGFSSLMLDEKNRVNAEIVLDSRTLQAHTGQRAFLYERLPDEEITAITSRDPLGSAKVASSLDFRFDLKDGDRTSSSPTERFCRTTAFGSKIPKSSPPTVPPFPGQNPPRGSA